MPRTARLAKRSGSVTSSLEFVTAMQRTQHDLPIDERIDFFFVARSWSGEPRIVEPEKCADLRWCRLDSLPDPVVPHELHSVECPPFGHRDGVLHLRLLGDP